MKQRLIYLISLCMILGLCPIKVSSEDDIQGGLPLPSIISVFPDSGSKDGNETIIITGKGFSSDDLVLIGGNEAISTIINSTTIKAVTPPGLPGRADIIVKDINGDGVLEKGFTYLPGDPEMVVAVNPVNGLTELPLNTPISIQFSRPVDPLTIDNDSFFLISTKTNRPVPGDFSFDFDNTMAIFKPFDNLDIRITYIISATQRIKSIDGVPLERPFISSFSTCKVLDNRSPEVVVTPEDGSPDIPFNTSLIFMFNEPLNPITVSPYTIKILEDGKIKGGEINIGMNNTVVTFTPRTLFSPNSSIKVALSPKITDIAGNSIGGNNENNNEIREEIISNFITSTKMDLLPPLISETIPPDGAKAVKNKTHIYIRFNEPINPLTVRPDTFSISVEGKDMVKGRLFFSEQNSAIVYLPDRFLPTLSVVKITLNKGITDMAGNPITSPLKRSFITQPADDLPLSIAGLHFLP